MATVTMELRHLMQMPNFKLFDFDYEVTDLDFKRDLEDAIINHFYFYEIGLETADRFKHEFETKFKRIMTYYNKLYMTSLLEIDPTLNYKMTETMDDKTTGARGTKADSTSTTAADRTEYPQTSNIDTDIPSDRAREVTEIDNEGVDVSADKRDYVKITEGYTSSPHELLKEYRNNILRITNMIIDELKPLFILVY